MTKGQGELILLTEKNIETTQGFAIGRMTMKMMKQVNDSGEQTVRRRDGNQEDGELDVGKDVVIRLKSFFVRRTNIYLEELSGQIRCLQSTMVKMQKALKKTQRLTEQKEQI